LADDADDAGRLGNPFRVIGIIGRVISADDASLRRRHRPRPMLRNLAGFFLRFSYGNHSEGTGQIRVTGVIGAHPAVGSADPADSGCISSI
jgi:hypothetical protein